MGQGQSGSPWRELDADVLTSSKKLSFAGHRVKYKKTLQVKFKIGAGPAEALSTFCGCVICIDPTGPANVGVELFWIRFCSRNVKWSTLVYYRQADLLNQGDPSLSASQALASGGRLASNLSIWCSK
jgi:hypothetical protein